MTAWQPGKLSALAKEDFRLPTSHLCSGVFRPKGRPTSCAICIRFGYGAYRREYPDSEGFLKLCRRLPRSKEWLLLNACSHLQKVITPEILECQEAPDMYFHGFRVRVSKGDQAKHFTPDDAYRVLAMNIDKPTGQVLLLRDEKAELRWVSIGDVKVHSIDLPR